MDNSEIIMQNEEECESINFTPMQNVSNLPHYSDISEDDDNVMEVNNEGGAVANDR